MTIGLVSVAPDSVPGSPPALYRRYGKGAAGSAYTFRPGGAAAATNIAVKSSNDVLVAELLERFTLLGGLQDGWDGPKSKAPTQLALMGMITLGNLIIDNPRLTPHALNITPAGTGEICFTLFGENGREAEFWVGQDLDMVTFVLTDGDELHDGELPTGQYQQVVDWLLGGTTLPA